MKNLTITLVISDDEADALVDLLRVGDRQRYGHGLDHAAARLLSYVPARVDDARVARGRKIAKKATR